MTISLRKSLHLLYLVLIAVSLIITLNYNKSVIIRRSLGISLPDGDCIWTDAMPLGEDVDPYGTLLAAYPGSGMRTAWQQTEGITGIQVGDDFHLGGEDAYNKNGILKTQYPHLEGIWSFGNNMDQTILLLRNPRWAMPSYHSFLAEIHYAHDWQTAYEYLHDTFYKRSSLDDWRKWRDYRFTDEMDLWVWFIDYYMENGTQYWETFDFERNGQWPFKFQNDSFKEGFKDLHCEYDLDCFPKAIITYENLTDPVYGVSELAKIYDVIEGKRGMTLIDRSAIACMYHETWKYAKFPQNNNRNEHGPDREAYNFSLNQLRHMNSSLVALKEKYNSGIWVGNQRAGELCDYLQMYIDSNVDEIIQLEENPGPPTKAPTPEGGRELVKWYSSLGRGNRYDKAKVQALGHFWPMVRAFYENTTEGNPYEGLDITQVASHPFEKKSSGSAIPFEKSAQKKFGFNDTYYKCSIIPGKAC